MGVLWAHTGASYRMYSVNVHFTVGLTGENPQRWPVSGLCRLMLWCMYLCGHPLGGWVIAVLDGKGEGALPSQLFRSGGDGVATHCFHTGNMEVHPVCVCVCVCV